MNLTTPQLVLAGGAALTAAGVFGYIAYCGGHLTLTMWRTAMAQAEQNARAGRSPGPRKMRIMLIATAAVVTGASVVFWGYVITLFLARLS